MIHLEKSFAPDFAAIKSLHGEITRKIKKLDPEIRSSIEMAAWELLENGVKYHERFGLSHQLRFEMDIQEKVRIMVENQVALSEHTEEVTEIIRRIKRSPDIQQLYVRRLREIMMNRVPGQSKLGLLKVACEGQFQLSHKTKGDRLQIIAERQNQLKERQLMSPLYFEDLTIDISEDKSVTILTWRGRSRSLSPEKTLDAYLSNVHANLSGRKTILDFSELEAMNSSTVPPLLTFIRKLEEDSIPCLMIFNDREHWQKASFIPLNVMTNEFKYIKIKGVSLVAKPYSSFFDK